MEFERVTTADHPLYQDALALYRASFPPHEQREAASQQAILGNEAYHFDLLLDAGEWVGDALYWDAGDFLYLEHFCIRPELRNRRYGQKALEVLCRRPLILEIDPPVDEISIRRKGTLRALRTGRKPVSARAPAVSRGQSRPRPGAHDRAQADHLTGIRRIHPVSARRSDEGRLLIRMQPAG